MDGEDDVSDAVAGEEPTDPGPVDDLLDPAGAAEELPEPPHTDDPGVDAAMAELVEAVRGPLDGQVAAYDRAHRALQDRLADVEG